MLSHLTPSNHPFFWLYCSFDNTLSLDSHIRICAVDIRFACLGFCFAFFLIELSRRLGFDFWISLKFLSPVTLTLWYIYKCIHTNVHVYISFHLEETYDVCEKCTQPLESNIKCIMYTRSSVFRTPAHRAPEHTVVIRFGILSYINIYFHMYFSLFFYLFESLAEIFSILNTSPYLNSTLLFCVCANMHTYIYQEFSYYYNKNSITVYSWKKNTKHFFSSPWKLCTNCLKHTRIFYHYVLFLLVHRYWPTPSLAIITIADIIG